VKRRLGLVAEVHRCFVYGDDQGHGWAWMCLRPCCDRSGWGYRSQPASLAKALAHARAFVPETPEEEPLTELQWALCMALTADMARQRETDEAALGARIAAVAEQVNGALAGILPEGMRFEWAPDGG
jgi:hypothetical protein